MKPVPPDLGYVLDHYRIDIDRNSGRIGLTSRECDCAEVASATDRSVVAEDDRSITLGWKSVRKSTSGKTYHFSERMVIQKRTGKAQLTLRSVGKRKIEARGTCVIR